MTKLNQIIAVERGVAQKTDREITDIYHLLQKAPPFSGISRVYTPKDDDGDQLPSETQLVQARAGDSIAQMAQALTRLFDVTLTKEVANSTIANADIVVDGATIAEDVPVTFMLFLEKQLVHVRTFISKLPVLDASVEWHRDPALPAGVWSTDEIGSIKTSKIRKNWVKAEATDKHPAQVEVYHEDEIVGYWSTRKFSGAIPIERRDELLERVEKLMNAVKFAREEANSKEIVDQHAGAAYFSYLFG